MNEVLLTINPNWPPPPAGQNVVLFIQACTSSDLVQRVTVSGEGLPEPVTAESSPDMQYGTQYLNYEVALPSSTLPSPNWQWLVAVSHQVVTDGEDVKDWVDSEVRGSSSVSIGEGLMYAAYALCNDADAVDRDYNDTVVEIRVFNNSID